MNLRTTLRTAILTKLAASLALAAAACGPDPAGTPAEPPRGEPIAGAPPVRGEPIDAPASPGAPVPSASEGDTAAVPPPAPALPGPALPDLGDVTPSSEAVPAEEPPVASVSAPPPAPPPTQPSAPPTQAPTRPAPGEAAAPPPPAPEDLAGAAAAEAAAAKAADAAKSAGAAKADPAAKPEAPQTLTFETLASFEYLPPDPEVAGSEIKSLASIPEEIKKLDGLRVSVEGYMLPLEYADEGVRAFLLSRHQMGCCFGVLPKPNELVECEMPEGEIAPYVSYMTVIVTGKLRVGPKEGASTVLSGIYRLEGPKVTIPEPDDGTR
jgi:hypothetical protein